MEHLCRVDVRAVKGFWGLRDEGPDVAVVDNVPERGEVRRGRDVGVVLGRIDALGLILRIKDVLFPGVPEVVRDDLVDVPEEIDVRGADRGVGERNLKDVPVIARRHPSFERFLAVRRFERDGIVIPLLQKIGIDIETAVARHQAGNTIPFISECLFEQ